MKKMLLNNSGKSMYPLSNLNGNATLKSYHLSVINDWIFGKILHRNKIYHKSYLNLIKPDGYNTFGKTVKFSKYSKN